MSKNKLNIETLESRIKELESRKVLQEKLIVAEFQNLKIALQPSNIIKNSIRHISEDKETKGQLVAYATAIGIHFLSRRFLSGKTSDTVSSIVKQLVNLWPTKSESGKWSAYAKAIINNLLGPTREQGKEN